jgi:curli production assembly/transport CsgH protein
MFNAISALAFWMLPLSIGWGAVALANGNGAEAVPEDRIATLPACEIRVHQSGDSIVLEGLVFAPADLSGSYHMQVRQNGLGSSRISQSGDFKVRAGAPGSLGIVSLAKAAGSYLATLTVSWDDGTTNCVAQAPKSRKVKLLDKDSVLPGADKPPSAPVQPHRGALDPAAAE